MQLASIGQLIAFRTLQLTGKNPTNVMISIGQPQKFPDGEDYYCPFQITGIGETITAL